jgi:hypothetical protein
MAKGELFFVANIVKPLYVEIDRFLDGAIVRQVENIDANILNWKCIINEETTAQETATQEAAKLK